MRRSNIIHEYEELQGIVKVSNSISASAKLPSSCSCLQNREFSVYIYFSLHFGKFFTCSNDFMVVAGCRNWLFFNSIMEPAVVTYTNKVTKYMYIHVCNSRRGSGRHVYGRPASSWTRSDVKKTSANMDIDLLAVVAVLLATDIIRRSSNSWSLLLPAAQYSIFLISTPVLDH
jgi:hypothetical protein